MKIIYGKLPAEQIWTGQCYHCGTKVEVSEKEVSSIHGTKAINCPLPDCNRKIGLYVLNLNTDPCHQCPIGEKQCWNCPKKDLR